MSTIPPDRVVTGTEPTQLNIYLHRVTPNPGWCNHDLPSRDTGGARVTAPPLALDLHYLMTAYGKDHFVAEVLLGHAMQVMHERPVLTRDEVRAALNATPPDPTIPSAVSASQRPTRSSRCGSPWRRSRQKSRPGCGLRSRRTTA